MMSVCACDTVWCGVCVCVRACAVGWGSSDAVAVHRSAKGPFVAVVLAPLRAASRCATLVQQRLAGITAYSELITHSTHRTGGLINQ